MKKTRTYWLGVKAEYKAIIKKCKDLKHKALMRSVLKEVIEVKILTSK